MRPPAVESRLTHCHAVQELQWHRDVQWGGLQAGDAFPKPKPVFKRIEDPAPADTRAAVAA